MGPVHYYDSTASTDSSGDERADSSSVTACNPGFCPLHAVGDRDTNRKPEVLPERQCGVSRVPLLVRLQGGLGHGRHQESSRQPPGKRAAGGNSYTENM